MGEMIADLTVAGQCRTLHAMFQAGTTGFALYPLASGPSGTSIYIIRLPKVYLIGRYRQMLWIAIQSAAILSGTRLIVSAG